LFETATSVCRNTATAAFTVVHAMGRCTELPKNPSTLERQTESSKARTTLSARYAQRHEERLSWISQSQLVSAIRGYSPLPSGSMPPGLLYWFGVLVRSAASMFGVFVWGRVIGTRQG
jgi:hypothetical protein